MIPQIHRSLVALGDYFTSKTRLRRDYSKLPTGLALITIDYERESDVEFETVREKLNKITRHSHSVQHLLIWDRLHSLQDSPFHHIMQIMQKSNVQGLCLVLKYTTQTEVLRTLRKLCSSLWSRKTVALEDQCCPPLPMCIMVFAKNEESLDQLAMKRLMLLEIAPILPTVRATVPKDMHFIKIKFCFDQKETDLIAEESAEWLKNVAKRYARYCEGKSIWSGISWEKVLQRERKHTWKNIAKSFSDGPVPHHRYPLKRSQSEPAVAPRRKPFVADETIVTYGEEAAAVAAQLKHYHKHKGVWAFKLPKTKYLHKIFLELVHLREAMRIKLIHRRQYFQRTGMHRGFTNPIERFYTRFQWIKSYSHGKTDQLVIYFHYGSVVQFNIARMKEALTPCDIHILRNHLLAHSEAKKRQTSSARTENLEVLWRRLQRTE